jgi:hypothetical protein
MDLCRPAECGVLPLPTLGVRPPEKVKLVREMRLPKLLGTGHGSENGHPWSPLEQFAIGHHCHRWLLSVIIGHHLQMTQGEINGDKVVVCTNHH